MRMLVVGAALVLVFALSFVAGNPGSGFAPPLHRTGANSGAGPQTDAFFHTRIGQVHLDKLGENRCWSFDFDNKTGRYGNYRRMPCANSAVIKPPLMETPPAQSQNNDRFLAVRDAFTNRRSAP
jgi:hypothetical protein